MAGEMVSLRHQQILLDLALGIAPEVVAQDRNMNVGSIYRIAESDAAKKIIKDYQEQIEKSKIDRTIERVDKLRNRIEKDIEIILEEKLACVTQNKSWATKDKAATDLLRWYGIGEVEHEPEEHKTPQCVVVVDLQESDERGGS